MALQRIGSEEDNQPVSVSRVEDHGGGAGMAVLLIFLGLVAIVGPFFIEKIRRSARSSFPAPGWACSSPVAFCSRSLACT